MREAKKMIEQVQEPVVNEAGIKKQLIDHIVSISREAFDNKAQVAEWVRQNWGDLTINKMDVDTLREVLEKIQQIDPFENETEGKLLDVVKTDEVPSGFTN
jgi:hypothetical protein